MVFVFVVLGDVLAVFDVGVGLVVFACPGVIFAGIVLDVVEEGAGWLFEIVFVVVVAGAGVG